MAKIGQRRTILVNPAGRKNGPRRKLSDKQIKHFGTKRQKAALAARKHAARTNRASPKRSTPKKSHRPAVRPAAKKRSNPGGIIEAALVNPAPKRRNSVAQAKKKSSAGRHSAKKQRPNPAVRPRQMSDRIIVGKRHNKVRRNPAFGGLIVSAGWAIGGAVGSKMLTQAVLGANNTGFIGYGGNLAAAFLLGAVVNMGFKGGGPYSPGNMVILGGVIQTLLRFLTDQTPLGERLKSVGMGDYLAQGFLAPQRLANGLRNAEIQYPPQIRPAPPVVIQTNGAAAKMAGLSTMGRGLF